MTISTFAADNADAVLQIPDGGEVSLFFRPFLQEFLDEMQKKFELILYSSLSKSTLNAVMNHIEKKQKYFVHCFDESFCIFANVSYGVKCIDFLLTNRSAEDIIVVDTTVKALPLTPDNLVPISRYDQNSDDTELVKLAVALDLISKESDVRIAIKKNRPSL